MTSQQAMLDRVHALAVAAMEGATPKHRPTNAVGRPPSAPEVACGATLTPSERKRLAHLRPEVVRSLEKLLAHLPTGGAGATQRPRSAGGVCGCGRAPAKPAAPLRVK